MTIKKYFLIIIFTYHSMYSTSQIIKEVTVNEFAKYNPHAQIIQCTKNYPYTFNAYPLYQQHSDTRFPDQGIFQDTFIISIPNGTAHLYQDNYWGVAGLVFLNGYFIKECQIKNISPFCYAKTNEIAINTIPFPIDLKGSAAICWHLFPQCYGHFILDILCQLALLEIHNMAYDHLCIPYSDHFMHDLLKLWGIDEDKIIPYTNNTIISADTIILPTAVTQTQKIIPVTNYSMDFLIQYVSKKLITNIQKINNDVTTSQKIFISRKDSKLRNIPNEDEIFQEFEKRGFKRYELSKLSIIEQIILFHNATAIVSFVGSGATNIIFSKQGTKYIEIIQTMVDATFFFLANIIKLEYYDINNSTYHDFLNGSQTTQGRAIPINIIQDFLMEHPEL